MLRVKSFSKLKIHFSIQVRSTDQAKIMCTPSGVQNCGARVNKLFAGRLFKKEREEKRNNQMHLFFNVFIKAVRKRNFATRR